MGIEKIYFRSSRTGNHIFGLIIFIIVFPRRYIPLFNTHGLFYLCLYAILAWRWQPPGKDKGFCTQAAGLGWRWKTIGHRLWERSACLEAAINYPQTHIVGIDYWGGQWEYSKESCEKNAQIAGVSERTSFQKASAAKLPFTDEFFDVALSNFVFHEVQDVKDKRAVIKEALRIIKKDGLF